MINQAIASDMHIYKYLELIQQNLHCNPLYLLNLRICFKINSLQFTENLLNIMGIEIYLNKHPIYKSS